jgi:ribosome maturation factor RimP
LPDDDRLQRIREVAERVARGYELEIFDVQLRRESIGWVLRIFIDRPGSEAPGAGSGDGVSIQDCERVSQDVSAILDVEDPLEHPYTLEVSSPGLDRPLRHAGDYRRFAGRLATIVASAPVDGRTLFRGRLRGVEQDAVMIEVRDGRTERIPLSSIARAHLEVEFQPAGRLAGRRG